MQETGVYASYIQKCFFLCMCNLFSSSMTFLFLCFPDLVCSLCPGISSCTLFTYVGVLSPCILLTGIQGSRSIQLLPTSVPLKSYTQLCLPIVIYGNQRDHSTSLIMLGAVLGSQACSQWTTDLTGLSKLLSSWRIVCSLLCLPPKSNLEHTAASCELGS